MPAPDTTEAPAPRSLKERQREERAALILQAAEAVLAEKGYHDTSMDEIAARVGIAKGTIYLHYPSKDDLVIALFAREMVAFRLFVEQTVMDPMPARERLEAVMRHVYGDLRSQRRQLFASLAANMSLPQGMFAKRAELREPVERFSALLREVFVEGQANGEFDPRIPASVMLTSFLSLLSPRSYAPLLDKEPLTTDELVWGVSRIFFHGITEGSNTNRI